MPAWEYISINLSDLPLETDDIDVLNDAGKIGWELVAITSNNIAFLKRPIATRTTRSARSSVASSQQ